MLAFSLAFLSGVIVLQFFSFLPPLSWSYWAGGAALMLGWSRIPYKNLGLGLLLGFAWCVYYAHTLSEFTLPTNLEEKTVWIRGTIASLPRISNLQDSFIFQTQSIQNEPIKTRIVLSWRHAKFSIRVGDEWLLPLRLKRIHSPLNPGSMDYEAWAFQNGIRAKGYVEIKEKAMFITAHPWVYPLNYLRQTLQERIQYYLTPSSTSAWITALIIGERAGIPASAWTVLRNTGTNHLMAIAGLHIGFLAALTRSIVKFGYRFCPQAMLKIPLQQVVAAVALTASLLYSALAGFSIPTQRALIMISVLLLTVLYKRILPLWQAWSLALFLVLLLNPLNVLSSSFWLSFTTLALIIYSLSGHSNAEKNWWNWARPQWVITLGLLPLNLWLFTQYSLISLIANAIAIPWMGFLILPFCFISVILLLLNSSTAALSLLLADKSLSLLWLILSGLSQWSSAIWTQALPNYLYLIVATIGVLILLLPAGFPGRYFGLAWLLPIIFFKASAIQSGEFKLSLLDVGQGLASVVQTQNHTLIFDTGAHIGDLDMGEAVILPYLAIEGIKHIDMMVISHGDNDHRGGAAAILKQVPVLDLKTSVPQLFPAQAASYCVAGQSWDWDGVQFKFLHPTAGQLNQGNNSSCVLQIAASDHRVLLTGDIEGPAEKELIAEYGADLAADILVAPHHGSKTSGLRDFIGRVHPHYVLYATGYRNRYHFPHPSVVQTYQEWGAVQYDTVSAGAIEFRVGKQGLKPSLYRQQNRRYWND